MSSKTTATTAIASAEAALVQLVDEGTTLTVDEIERLVGDVRTELNDAITALASEYGVKSDGACTQLRALGVAVTDAATALIEDGRAVQLWTVPATMPAILVAHRLYEDVTRALEIVHLNRPSDPSAIPAGTVLRVYPA